VEYGLTVVLLDDGTRGLALTEPRYIEIPFIFVVNQTQALLKYFRIYLNGQLDLIFLKLFQFNPYGFKI
jgi:hypothetical protein